jgi:hypothetical protein
MHDPGVSLKRPLSVCSGPDLSLLTVVPSTWSVSWSDWRVTAIHGDAIRVWIYGGENHRVLVAVPLRPGRVGKSVAQSDSAALHRYLRRF